MKIAMIGGGNMGSAILGGLAKGGAGYVLTVLDHHEEKRDYFKAMGVELYTVPGQWISEAEIVILAVKPQGMQKCIDEIRPYLPENALYISIAAGITVETLEKWTGSTAIVRVMPNTPSLIGKGFSGVYVSPKAPKEAAEITRTIMSSVGQVTMLSKESDIHTIIGGSGSGPAYVFYFMESLRDALIARGMDYNQARDVTIATLEGAVALTKASDKDFETLRLNVTSKGGTTAKAVEAFTEGGLKPLVDRAVDACMKRSVEMEALFK